MVTVCQPKAISMDFGFLRGRWFMYGRHGAELDWPEENEKYILLIFAAIKI